MRFSILTQDRKDHVVAAYSQGDIEKVASLLDLYNVIQCRSCDYTLAEIDAWVSWGIKNNKL